VARVENVGVEKIWHHFGKDEQCKDKENALELKLSECYESSSFNVQLLMVF